MERPVERSARGVLAGWKPLTDVVERERIVAEHISRAFEIRERRGRALVVALDWRGLAESALAAVAKLDVNDLRLVLGPTRDRERLRES